MWDRYDAASGAIPCKKCGIDMMESIQCRFGVDLDCRFTHDNLAPQKMKGPSRINIEINKQIMRDGVRALCTLIETRVGEFNHVNAGRNYLKNMMELEVIQRLGVFEFALLYGLQSFRQ